jgi:hypothetical protein
MRWRMRHYRRILASCLCLLGLGMTAWADAYYPPPPADVDIGKDAGLGNWVFVKIHLENGDELPFIIDTGCPITLIDKTLESKLGPCIDTGTIVDFGSKQEAGRYLAPKLFIGKTRLQTGSYVFAYNFNQLSWLSKHDIMGILGMDCLQHYCIQMDFKAGKMHFLNPNDLVTTNLGKAFPIIFSSEDQSEDELVRPYLHHEGLLDGTNLNLLIDTGDNVDGHVDTGLVKGHYFTRFIHLLVKERGLRVSKCTWDGDAYQKIVVNEAPHSNSLGLRFLARHLVTLDFPDRTLYLKKMTSGPPPRR